MQIYVTHEYIKSMNLFFIFLDCLILAIAITHMISQQIPKSGFF